MGFELIPRVHERHAFIALELSDQVDVLQQRLERRASKRDKLAQLLHAVGTQMCFVDQLRRADSGAVERSKPIPDTLYNRHSPFVFGNLLLEWQRHPVEANQAAVMDAPGWDACCGGHHVVKLRLTEIWPHLFNASGQDRVNHPAVKRENALKLTFANGFEPQRGHWCLPLDHDEADRAAVETRPFQHVVQRIPDLQLIQLRFEGATVFGVNLRSDANAFAGHIVRDSVDRFADDPGRTIGPFHQHAVAAGEVRPVGRC